MHFNFVTMLSLLLDSPETNVLSTCVMASFLRSIEETPARALPSPHPRNDVRSY